MPLYEYQCKKCHSLTERIQKFSDPPLTVCPHCGGELEQQVSAPAIQFKGSGWYVSDYAKQGTGAAKGNGSAPSSSSESQVASPAGATASNNKDTSGSGKETSKSSRETPNSSKEKTPGKK